MRELMLRRRLRDWNERCTRVANTKGKKKKGTDPGVGVVRLIRQEQRSGIVQRLKLVNKEQLIGLSY